MLWRWECGVYERVIGQSQFVKTWSISYCNCVRVLLRGLSKFQISDSRFSYVDTHLFISLQQYFLSISIITTTHRYQIMNDISDKILKKHTNSSVWSRDEGRECQKRAFEEQRRDSRGMRRLGLSSGRFDNGVRSIIISKLEIVWGRR